MFKEECFCCLCDIINKKDCYEAGDVVAGGKYYCKKCAMEIGVKNRFSAAFKSKLEVIRKYAAIHPEVDSVYNKYMLLVSKRNLINLKDAEKTMLRAKSKEKIQEKYTCVSCKNVWYVSEVDHVKNLYNATKGNFYTLNQLKNVSQCPKCGSCATRMEKKKYWLDKNGQCVDIED